MKRTLIVFLVLVALFFTFDQVARRFLGLDCIGPVLPVWGCLAQPYPTTLGSIGDFSGSILTYTGLLAGVLVAAWLLRNLVFTVGGYLLGRYRPEMATKLAGQDEPKGYPVR
ncbi:MAG TPA: hypothetical protein VNG93_14085 [Candidatus Dormibacteraeota bacterium]|nr:hypothetical protein [Candidatus Dormibacteraeota bacterium]